MRIVIVYYQNLYDEHAGGILNYTRGMIQHSGSEFKYVYWGKEVTNKTKFERYHNCEVKYFLSQRRWKYVPEIIRINYYMFRVRKKIESDGDILFLQLPELIFPWALSSRKIPIIIRIPGCRRNDHLILPKHHVMFNKFSDKVAIKRAEKIIVVSKEGYNYYTQRFPEYQQKIIHIPTFADDDIVPLLSREEAVNELNLPSHKNICYIGRLDEPKRLDVLIRVFFHIQERIPESRLYIAGEGPLKKMMYDMGKELDILSKITFLGVIDRDKVGLLFRASEINFLLTKFEGNSLSLMESLACGTPSIVSDVADHRYIIQNEINGYVIKDETPEEISDIAVRIMNNYPWLHQKTLEMGKQYLASNIVPRVLEVFRNTLKG